MNCLIRAYQPMPSNQAIRLLMLTMSTLMLISGCGSTGRDGLLNSSEVHWNGKERVELPMELGSRGFPTVTVRVGDQELVALIDSGANTAVMTPEVGKKFASRPSNIEGWEVATDVPVQLGQLSIQLDHVAIRDLPGDISFVLGADLFSQTIVDMDFANARLTLIRPQNFVPPSKTPVLVEMWRRLPTVELTLGGNSEICAIVDTGFNLGVAVTEAAASQLALEKLPNGAAAADSIHGRVVSQAFVSQQVEFGGNSYHGVRVVTFPGNGYCDGLLGMAILARHQLIFDLMNRHIWLLP